jgi:hypothetical protein
MIVARDITSKSASSSLLRVLVVLELLLVLVILPAMMMTPPPHCDCYQGVAMAIIARSDTDVTRHY